MQDNFAWTLTDISGNLLAYQEKPISGQPAPKPHIIDEDKAKKRCIEIVSQLLFDPTLDYLGAMQAIGQIAYVADKISGRIEKPKSKIILPGQ